MYQAKILGVNHESEFEFLRGLELPVEFEEADQSTFYARVVGAVSGLVGSGYHVTNIEITRIETVSS